MPEDDQESHEDYDTPDTDEDEKHDAFLLQPFDITGHNPSDDPTILLFATSAPNGSESNRARNLIHISGRKDERRLVHPRHVNVQVVVHERQRVGQSIHFGPDETENEILHGLLEDGSTEDGVNQILNLAVEVVQGGVESGGGRVDPTEDLFVDGVLDVVDFGVDLGSVHCGLVQHVLVYGRSDGVREVIRRGERLILVRLCNGTKSQNLELNGEEADKADEKARKDGWVENITEEPLGVDVLGRRKTEEGGDLVGNSHEKRVSGDSVEGEEVVVRELDAGSGVGDGMVIDSGIRVPGLASVLEVVLETAPLVPFKNAVCQYEEDNDSDDDDRANLGYLDEVTAEVVNHRGVNLIAESDRGLLRNGEDGWVERNAVERVIDLLLGQLEGSIKAGN